MGSVAINGMINLQSAFDMSVCMKDVFKIYMLILIEVRHF